MDSTMIANLFILLLSLVAGGELLKRMTPEQHPTLLTALTALGGVVLIGALLTAGQRPGLDRSGLLGFFAVASATVALVGGFLASAPTKAKSEPEKTTSHK